MIISIKTRQKKWLTIIAISLIKTLEISRRKESLLNKASHEFSYVLCHGEYNFPEESIYYTRYYFAKLARFALKCAIIGERHETNHALGISDERKNR